MARLRIAAGIIRQDCSDRDGTFHPEELDLDERLAPGAPVELELLLAG